MYFVVALLGELQEVGAPEIGEGGSESWVLRDGLLEQWNRRLERPWPIVVRQQIVCPPVVLLRAGQWHFDTSWREDRPRSREGQEESHGGGNGRQHPGARNPRPGGRRCDRCSGAHADGIG